MIKARRIKIQGIVQGVGFRPFVWQKAHKHSIKGSVLNNAEGVLIDAFATDSIINAFIESLGDDVPPLAQIDSITSTVANRIASINLPHRSAIFFPKVPDLSTS